MADTISIASPLSGSTVGHSFSASGSSVFNPASGSNTTIAVKLLDSAGNLIPVTGSNPVIISVPGSSTLYPWFAPFSVSQDYSGCAITAEIVVSGTQTATAKVQNITIA